MNRSTTLKASFAIVVSTLIACSSPIKTANKLMESGNFQEAVILLEKAHTEKPKEVDILAKLREARTKLVQRKFIEVRLTRMAGNSESALELLSEALEQREKWRSSLNHQSSGVQVTIEEESSYARPTLRRRIDQLSISPLPWPTLKERRKHRILYSELPLEWRKKTEALERARAKAQCKTFGAEKTAETPFLNRWIDQACSPWSVPAEPKYPIDPGFVNWRGTFGSALIRGSGEQLQGDLASLAQTAFQSSPWSEVASREVLDISTNSNFLETERRHPQNRSLRYTVPKTIEIQEPNGTIRRETQQESREFRYTVDVVSRTFQMEASLSCSPGGRPISFQFKQSKTQQDETHAYQDSAAGIQPDPLKLEDSGPWLREQIETIRREWNKKLEEGWAEAYCSGNSPFQLKAEENFARCFRSELGQRTSSPPFQQFTQERFGLSPLDLSWTLKN